MRKVIDYSLIEVQTILLGDKMKLNFDLYKQYYPGKNVFANYMNAAYRSPKLKIAYAKIIDYTCSFYQQ